MYAYDIFIFRKYIFMYISERATCTIICQFNWWIARVDLSWPAWCWSTYSRSEMSAHSPIYNKKKQLKVTLEKKKSNINNWSRLHLLSGFGLSPNTDQYCREFFYSINFGKLLFSLAFLYTPLVKISIYLPQLCKHK